MNESYESIMHVIVEKLMVHFEGSGATNYIEQTFEDKEDRSKSFTLTMQMTEGLTPCQKLTIAENRIKELESELANTQLVVTEIQDLSSEVSCFIENLDCVPYIDEAKALNTCLVIGSKIRDLDLPEFILSKE